MTDDAATTEKKDWTYTQVEADKECFTALKYYAAANCDGTAATALAADGTMAGGTAAYSSSGKLGSWVLMGDPAADASFHNVKACDGTKITLSQVKAVAGKPTAGPTADEVAVYPDTPVETVITYDAAKVKVDGSSGCVGFGAGVTDKMVSFTVSGWADPDAAADADASGAKTLAAAFTAGALTLAATQF